MDLANMKPAGKSKKAATNGALAKGHAMGLLMLRDADKKADAEAKARESMKDTLKRLQGLERDGHLEFRKVLEGRKAEIQERATIANVNLQTWFTMESKDGSVYATISLWLKMSKALETGWIPDYSMAWGIISMAATDALAAKASDGTDKPQTAAPTTRRGRKAKATTVEDDGDDDGDDKPTNQEKTASLLFGWLKQMKDMPLQTLEEFHKALGNMIDQRKRPAPVVAPAKTEPAPF